MTASDPAATISALLSETEQAHGAYEAAELSGVYDQDWPRWYAAYAVEHGLGELVGHDVPAEQLAAFLASTFDAFKGTDPKPAESWADWTARRISEEVWEPTDRARLTARQILEHRDADRT
jgi:hypothetical protein